MDSAVQLRTLLRLGRISTLPTVWSNCLAGWWLGGGGNFWKLPFLLLGTSVLYTGGMFLNDAFDVDFDRQRRPERPIPSGKISIQMVWRLGFGQLGAGVFLLLFCSQLSAGAAILLALCILLYNFSHKIFTASPWLVGACRFWIYVIAGAAGVGGLNGWPIFCGMALALYVTGLSFIAQRENFRTTLPRWPLVLLTTPIVLAFAMNASSFRLRALWMGVVFAAWMVWSMRKIISGTGNAAIIAANLIAGIVLVDWLAVAPQIDFWPGAVIFLALFGLTKWLQKFAPAS